LRNRRHLSSPAVDGPDEQEGIQSANAGISPSLFVREGARG